jgi:hypothetical protein
VSNPSTSYGPQIVANTAIDLVTTYWSTVCDSTWLKAMGAPNLPAPVAANCYTSRRALFTAEKQPAIGLSVVRSDSTITDALGAMDQVHELEIVVCSDWGYYDAFGVHPLVEADPGDPAIPFTPETYETALRAYVEGIVLILTSPVWGFPNLDARNRTTPNYPGTGIYNASPYTGVTPQDFVIGTDETGQTIMQETVRASIQVFQRRSLAR